MADALLQTLTIKLNAEVGNTKRKLNDVATSVEKLEEIGKKADWSVFEQIRTNLEGIAQIDFSNVANSLKDVVSAMKALGISAKQVKNMPVMSTPRMEDGEVNKTTEPSWQLQGVKMVANIFGAGTKYLQEFNAKIAEAKKGVNDVQDAFDPWRRSLAGCYLELNQIEFLVNQIKTKGAPVADFDALKQQLLEAGFSLNRVNELLSQIGKSNGFGNWEESLRQCGLTANEVGVVIKDLFEKQREPINFEKLRDVLISLGFTAKDAEATMAKLGKTNKKAGKDAEHGSKGFKKMLNSIKRITFYRLVRRAIQLIGQALTESIQKMATFDSGFNKSMSEIKSSLSYFKNSLATVIAPIVEMLTPIITALLDGLAEINNLLGELFSAIAGKDYFQQATKGAEDYAESLKKVKNQALGIDELNVLQSDEEDNPFEQVAVGIENSGSLGGFFGDFGATLKDFISKLKDSLMPVIEAISKLFDAITPILNIVMSLLDDLFSNTMDGVSNSIASFIDMVAEILTAIGDFLEIVKPILDIANQVFGIFLNLFNSGLEAIFKTIADVVSKIFKTEEGDNTKFADFLETIVGGLVNIITWVMDIANLLKTRFKSAWKKWTTKSESNPDYSEATMEGLGGQLGFPSKATGGFVEDGFFFANHNELVGQFSNGKTAVANNEQITEGIYRAVKEAIQESNFGNDGNREIVVKIDNRELGRAVDKYERQKGYRDMYNGGKGYGF